jgi:hypothetical protein
MITTGHKRRKQATKMSNNEQLKASQTAVPTGGPEERMPAIDKPLQGLKFVDVTPRYLQGTRDSVEQRSIRVHVMQDFIRQKKQATDALEPPAMAGTVSGHVHRFRISKPRLPDKPLGTELFQKAILGSQESRQGVSSRTFPNTIRDVRGLPKSETGDPASGHQPSHVGALPVEERVSASHPRISPNLPGVTARMDPFARLPIDGSLETHETLDYCEQHLLLVLSHVPMQSCILEYSGTKALKRDVLYENSKGLIQGLEFPITRSSYALFAS